MHIKFDLLKSGEHQVKCQACALTGPASKPCHSTLAPKPKHRNRGNSNAGPGYSACAMAHDELDFGQGIIN